MTTAKPAGYSRKALGMRHRLRPYLAEFLGTFMLVFIGDGVCAQYILSRGTHGSWLGLNIAWASGVMLAGLIAGPVSGAHLNPAVSICLSIFPRNGVLFPLRKLPGYIFSQMLGGFFAAALVFVQYSHQIYTYESATDASQLTVPYGSTQSLGLGPTAGIFATYPVAGAPLMTSFFSEYLASALLMLGIFTITSGRNKTLGASAHFSIFILFLAIGSSQGWQTGYATSAARDLAPRLFTALVYGKEVFTVAGHYWFIPVVAPIFGTLTGGLVYELFIGEPRGLVETWAANNEAEDDQLTLN